jgi:uncharacterized protein (TIGR03118 family)
MKFRSAFAPVSAAILGVSLVPAAPGQATTPATPQQYAQTNLVSNVSGQAAVTDPNLVNAWGLSRSSNGDWWVADTGTGLSTLYDGTTGKITPLVVTIPSSNPQEIPHGLPTGTIFNGSTGFALASGKPAIFLFCTLDGTISGWNPSVAPTNAVIKVNEKGASTFTGLTMAEAKIDGVTSSYLYAADFQKGRIAVYDVNFKHTAAIEKKLASMPLAEGYAPYNIQNLGGNLYIALAKKNSNGRDDAGAGLGEVVVISPEGELLQVFEYGSYFNAPWGLAIAPSDFGAYSHDVLVGNFGDGTILAFDPVTGKFKGKLEDSKKKPIVIPGLWALSVGNNTELGGSATSVFFAAGPNGEQDGLFGTLSALSNPAGNDQ